jgi:hypothetical protein
MLLLGEEILDASFMIGFCIRFTVTQFGILVAGSILKEPILAP